MHKVDLVSVIKFDRSIAGQWSTVKEALQRLDQVLLVDATTYEDDTIIVMRSVAPSANHMERVLSNLFKVNLDMYGVFVEVGPLETPEDDLVDLANVDTPEDDGDSSS